MTNYRIVELTHADDSVIYILEQDDPNTETGWKSVWRSPDLQLIREAKAKRENPTFKGRKVIE